MFVISLVAFWLGKVAPGDPVTQRFPADSDFEITRADYQRMFEQMGLDKPLFYLGFSSVAFPDTLYKIPGRYHQENISKLIAQYGNWEYIQTYNANLERLFKAVEDLPDDVDKNKKIEIRRAAYMLLEEYRDPQITSHLQKINTNVLEKPDSVLQSRLGEITQSLIQSYQAVKDQTSKYKLYIPVLNWHGLDNQYHHWITAFAKGDFGISYRSGQSVINRIKTPIFWTLTINL